MRAFKMCLRALVQLFNLGLKTLPLPAAWLAISIDHPNVGAATLNGRITQLNPTAALHGLNRIRFTGERFIAVGDRGAVAFSADGINWARYAAPTTLALYDVAYGNGRYVAAGDGGALFSSEDGREWTSRSIGIADISSVAFGNGTFALVTLGGGVQLSTDGINWSASSLSVGSSFSYGGVEFANGRFLFYGGSTITPSPDGKTPAGGGTAAIGDVMIGQSNNPRVVYGNGVYVLGGSTGLAYSSDGNSWNKAAVPGLRIEALAFGNGLFVVYDSAKNIWTSSDGAHWTFASRFDVAARSIAYGLGRFVAVGQELRTSTDGLRWVRLDEDQLLPNFTVTDWVVDRGTARLNVYHDQYNATDPAVGPPEISPVRGVYLPAVSSVGSLWVGDAGFIYYYVSSSPNIQNGYGFGPKLTDKTLRAAVGLTPERGYISGDAGVLIRVDRSNSLRGPTFELVESPTAADLLSGARNILVGAGGTILRNADPQGKEWTTVPAGTSATLRHVALYDYDDGLAKEWFIVVGDDGTILTSSDGAAWTKRESGTHVRLVGSAYAPSTVPRRFFVAGEDGSLLESTDGVAWTARAPLPISTPLRTFQRERSGGLSRITGLGTHQVVEDIFPPDGVTNTGFFAITSALHGVRLADLTGAALGNGRWVVVGGGVSATSPDGNHWISRQQTADFEGVAFGAGRFVAVSIEGKIASSGDGLSWAYQSVAPGGRAFHAVAYGGGRFAAVGAQGLIMISDDGVHWTDKSLPVANEFLAIAWSNYAFVAVGKNGIDVRSADHGDTWKIGNVFNADYYGVAFGKGTFAAVGTGGWSGSLVLGAAQWTTKRMPPLSAAESRPEFRRVLFVNDSFFATTQGGELFSSTNGLDWAPLYTGINRTLLAAAAGNGSLAVAGGNGIHFISIPDQGSPTITQNPVPSTTATEGQSLALSAAVAGASPLTYQWLHNNLPLVDGGRFAGATTPDLRITALEAEDDGEYVLTAVNHAGSRVSSPAIVRVAARARIVAQPQSTVAAVGTRLTLEVQAAGDGLAYQWFHNGAAVAGATATTLDLAKTIPGDAGEYYVEIANPVGLRRSETAAVSLFALPSGYAPDPQFPAPELGFTPLAVSTHHVQPDGKIIVAGSFRLTGPVSAALLRFNPDGSLDATFSAPVPDNQIRAIHTLADGSILIGGTFAKIGTTPRIGLARLNQNGTFDPAYDAGIGPANTGIYALKARPDGKILAGGTFSTFGSLPTIRNLGLLKADGNPETSFVPPNALNAYVLTMLPLSDGRLIIGGGFDRPKTLVRLNANTTVDNLFPESGSGPAAFGLSSHFNVFDLLAGADGTLYVAGYFNVYNPEQRPGLARTTANGTLDASFNAALPNDGATTIYSLAFLGDHLLVAGQFSAIGTNSAARNLALLNAAGMLVASPEMPTTDAVVQKATVLPDQTIIISGYFNTVGSQSKPMLAKLVPGGNADMVLTIVRQPQPLSVPTGGTASFTVAATGKGSLKFQWRKGAAEIPGATGSALKLDNIQASDAAEYSVLVTDAAGTLASNPATLSLASTSSTGFGSWAAAQNLPAGRAGQSDDADGDGLSNLTEYALATNPMLANADQKPRTTRLEVGGQTYPAIQFTRNSAATGVAIDVQASSTLSFGQPAAVVQTVEALGNGIERVTVRAADPLPALTTFFFNVRMKTP